MSERTWEGSCVELGQHNEDLHTTRKSEKVQSDGRASGAVRYEVIQRCLRDGACSCLSGVLGAVSMERPTRTHAGKARVAKESKAMGARGAVVILAPGCVADKFQRTDAMKKPMHSPCTCEPAGTMHVRCEWYVARSGSQEIWSESERM